MDTNLELNSNSSFRQFLRNELIRRSSKNENYSLRSFASQLGVNHATLSSILAGKRPLTEKSVVKLASGLKLSIEQTARFIKDLKSEPGESSSHQALVLDVFSVISEWYHDAILELIHTSNFQPDVKWIAKVLGISTTEVRSAVERLERLDLLEISNGKWKDLSRNNTTNTNNDITSAALRQLQAKILDLSAQALRDLPRTERDHTSLTVAMQKSDLPEVKERIKKFRFELVKFIERRQANPDAVFQFAFSVFPLTKQ